MTLSKEQQESVKKGLAQVADLVGKDETTAVAIAVADIGGTRVIVSGESADLVRGAVNILLVMANELGVSPDAMGECAKAMLLQKAKQQEGMAKNDNQN